MKKILIVESSPTIVSVADSLLRKRGFDVACLSDGLKALEFVKAERPDIVITGLGLPGLSGIELSRLISKDPQTGGIPIILLVGEKDDVFADKIDLCGARARLKKPFSPKEFVAAVEKFSGIAAGIKPPVDQQAEGVPRLKPKPATQEITTGVVSFAQEKSEAKRGTVVGLNWEDLGETSQPETRSDADGLVIEEDQYGLTQMAGSEKPTSREEDYEWFLNEMRSETTGAEKTSRQVKKPEEQKVSYTDLESPGSPTAQKYRRLVEQYKEEPGKISDRASAKSEVDLDALTELMAEKIARKIMEKIDKNQIRQILESLLSQKH